MRGPSGKLAGALWAGALLMAASVAHAQGRPEGIRLGRSMLYPSIEVEARDDDNIFQQEDAPVQTEVIEAGPTLEWRLPLSRSLISLAYRPRFKAYSGSVLPDTTTHLFDGEVRLVFRNGVAFGARDNFERGVLEVRDFTGGEPTFAGDRFTRNEIQAGFVFPLGRRQEVEVGGFQGSLRFADLDRASFFDFSDHGLAGAWGLKLAEQLTYRVEMRASENRQNRRALETFDLQTGEPLSLPSFQEEDYTDFSVRSGLEGRLGEHLNVLAYYGLGRLTFQDSAEKDYEGPILEVDSRVLLGQTLSIRLRANRRSLPSFFNVANFFVSEQAGLSFIWQTPRRLTLTLGGTRQTNTYKDPIVTDLDGNPQTGRDEFGNDILPDPEGGLVAGALRLDRIERLEARVEFIFIPNRLSAYLEIVDERRESNLRFARFDRRTVAVGVRFGWFPAESRGI